MFTVLAKWFDFYLKVSSALYNLKINKLETRIMNTSRKLFVKANIYLIGGREDYVVHLSRVSRYEHSTDNWIATTPMPSPRAHFGCGVIAGRIYVCGGSSGKSWRKEKPSNELIVFDTVTQTWTKKRPMKYGRRECAAAVLNGQLYVVGGNDCDDISPAVERYCPETDQWKKVSRIPTPRKSLEMVSLDGYLYAIGGYRTENVVERYDPQTDQWSRMADTKNGYTYFGSAVLNGRIYVVGENTCEVYSPADDRWTGMTPPRDRIIGRSLTAIDGQLIVTGGSLDLSTVQVYDFDSGVWREKSSIDVERICHGVAVV